MAMHCTTEQLEARAPAWRPWHFLGLAIGLALIGAALLI